MRKIIKIAIGVGAALAVAAGGTLFALYRATQHEPEFYIQAMRVDPARQAQAGYELERRLLDFHSKIQRRYRWAARFSADQINGWLAVDMPKKFPSILPHRVSDPRVAITDDLAQVACRYDRGNISVVVSLDLDVHLTDEPNVVAIRIQSARAGAVPVPLSQWLDRISRAAVKAGIQLRWSSIDGDPVALITLDLLQDDNSDRKLEIERMVLRDGELQLSGRTLQSDGSLLASEMVRTAASYEPAKTIIQR